MLTVRLDPDDERELERLAREQGMSRSDVVREALALYVRSAGAAEPSLAARFAPFVGVVTDGPPDLSERTGEKLEAILKAKAARRRR